MFTDFWTVFQSHPTEMSAIIVWCIIYTIAMMYAVLSFGKGK